MNRAGLTGAHNLRRPARLGAHKKEGDRAALFARGLHQSSEPNLRNRAVRRALENRKAQQIAATALATIPGTCHQQKQRRPPLQNAFLIGPSHRRTHHPLVS